MHSKMSKGGMAATAAGIAAATVAAGTAAYFMNAGSTKHRRKTMKRNAQRAMKTMGEAVGSVVDNVANNLMG
ncbi:MAG: hypothetical protein RR022_06480 [Angelakisella sp.]